MGGVSVTDAIAGEFDNAGAMMSIDESLMCSFQVRRAFCMQIV